MTSAQNKVYTVVTVGSFDGLHSGHRKLLDVLKLRAQTMGGICRMITFEPHPRIALGTDEGLSLLTTTFEKRILLSRIGIDNMDVIPFTPSFSHLTREQFLESFLIGRMHADEVVVGYDHRFGNQNSGDASFLRLSGKIQVTEVGQHTCSMRKVSSTVIRHLVNEGKMLEANELLGYRYLIAGIVAEDGTMKVGERKLLPPCGRYKCLANGQETVIEILSGERIRLSKENMGEQIIEICSNTL